jgi:DNA-binding NarL/FixJ family response regulator
MGNGLRILVVDDHRFVRRGICSLLSGQPDFDVIYDTSDGFQAVEAAGKSSTECRRPRYHHAGNGRF